MAVRRRRRAIASAGRVVSSLARRSLPRPVALALGLASIVRGVRPVKPDRVRQVDVVRMRQQALRVFRFTPQEMRGYVDRARENLRARYYREQRSRLLRAQLDWRTSFCRRRAARRAMMFVSGVAGVRGPRWSKMMRGARRNELSNLTCRS